MTLLEWINSHDCGVAPCGVQTPTGIAVRVDCVDSNGDHFTETTIVQTYAEARDALGY